jgi:hypothetical protein
MIFEDTLQTFTNTMIDITNQNQVSRLRHFFSIDPIIWSSLSEDKQILVKSYVEKLPENDFENIEQWLNFPFLKEEVYFRINVAKRSEMSSLIFFETPTEIIDHIIKLYLESGNFNEANSFAETVIQIVHDATKEQINYLITNISHNSQVSSSIKLSSVIWKIKKSKKYSKDELNILFKENDLRKYIDKDEDQE